MSFRYHRAIPVISLFHNNSPQSTQCLRLLRSALSGPYPPPDPKMQTIKPGNPLNFTLNEVKDQPPTPDQIRIILSYLKAPLATLVSSHPSVTFRPDSAESLYNESLQNPKVFRYPVACNWDDGEVALESSGIKRMLDNLAK
ncbi:uncharacterized protein EI90DRAFT_3080358 [Cantharellus anzutake]|uniref:uncharacterized protein n=1 Tax=Cantharellus anzutake TaxID=1750568 RepID=UPI001904F5A6|nr:uncharacterized protein EI90DRAFT_3080358 [Cantharellus anzutake]KAF8321042.1 hypothetical protein EI90DRAFT_3080358 [Cantharellus anzutake]